MTTLTQALARMALETKGKDLSEATVSATKCLILDTVATIIAGWREPGIPPVVGRMQTWGGSPEATILTY